jgi:hypothetical protein
MSRFLFFCEYCHKIKSYLYTTLTLSCSVFEMVKKIWLYLLLALSGKICTQYFAVSLYSSMWHSCVTSLPMWNKYCLHRFSQYSNKATCLVFPQAELIKPTSQVTSMHIHCFVNIDFRILKSMPVSLQWHEFGTKFKKIVICVQNFKWTRMDVWT